MNRRNQVLSKLLILAGLVLTLLPFGSHLVYRLQTKALADQLLENEPDSEQNYAKILDDARLWNEQLGRAAGEIDEEDEAYLDQLCFYGDGIMGLISIDRIDLRVPIYHGCSDRVLSKGAGHVASNALPIGTTGGRPLIAAHSGSANAELFTRLDELEIGDWFSIENPMDTLDYQIIEIEVVEPEQTDHLVPVQGEDLLTLVTCTPYGINSHRLLLTGKRGIRPKEDFAKPKWTLRKGLKAGLLIVMFGLGMFELIQLVRKRK